MNEVLTIANSPVMWGLALFVIAIVVAQAGIFTRIALAFSDKFGILSKHEKSVVYKTATITSIGPAVAVFFIAISLIAIVGAPVTLMRIGVIGSAYYELYAAHQGATAAGAEIGTDSYTLQAFTASVWAMTLGGIGWLVGALVLTKRLGDAQSKLRQSSPRALLIMGAVTPTAIFLVLTANTVMNKTSLIGISIEQDKLVAALAAGLSMIMVRMIGKVYAWVREWGLGLSLVIGLVAGYLTSLTMA